MLCIVLYAVMCVLLGALLCDMLLVDLISLPCCALFYALCCAAGLHKKHYPVMDPYTYLSVKTPCYIAINPERQFTDAEKLSKRFTQ